MQEYEALHLASKLRGAHIKFSKQKIKVKLGAQLFSSSVAEAIKYCTIKLQLQEFEGSEATVEFENSLFDILNSRSNRQHGYINVNSYLYFLQKATLYILSLKGSLSEASTVEKSERKTGFIGFLICIKCFETIVSKKMFSRVPGSALLSLYKVGQDHVELGFFSVVQFHGGSNDNPTAIQFRAACRKLLQK